MEYQNLPAQLQGFMAEHGISQTQVAKSIGKSVAAINQWLQGKYGGDSTAINILVGNYLERERAKLALTKLEQVFVATKTAQNINKLLGAVRATGELGVLYGNAGLGKTTALRQYAAETPDAILIETLTTYTSSVLLKTIARKIGANTAGSLHEVNEAVMDKLADSGRLLLIDEAENLSTRSLEILRRLHDQTGIGLVLAGTPRLLVNLCGKRGELAQLYSRAGYSLNLGTEIPDGQMMEIVKQHLSEAEDDVCAMIVKEAHGIPRRLWKLMFHVDRIGKSYKQAPTVEMVAEVSKMLIRN